MVNQIQWWQCCSWLNDKNYGIEVDKMHEITGDPPKDKGNWYIQEYVIAVVIIVAEVMECMQKI